MPGLEFEPESEYVRWQRVTDDLKRTAVGLGFELCGIANAQEAPNYDRFCEWLARGYAGTMRYLTDRKGCYQHPRSVLTGVQTVVMLGMAYKSPHPDPVEQFGAGRIASYATGNRDYHDVIHDSLRQLRRWLIQNYPDAQVRGVVDTAPLLEREFARLAGIGWVGKNTLLLSRTIGSYFFLAALLTSLPLVADEPFASDHCGTCTACLDACPTQAFPQAYVLDSTRCISYLTIEHRDEIPLELRNGIGDRVFGCDVCQQVCPWNRKPAAATQVDVVPQTDHQQVDLIELIRMTEEQFRDRFRATPIWRTRHRGMLRNAIIAIGNQRLREATEDLKRFIAGEDELLRETAAWALNKIESMGRK